MFVSLYSQQSADFPVVYGEIECRGLDYKEDVASCTLKVKRLTACLAACNGIRRHGFYAAFCAVVVFGGMVLMCSVLVTACLWVLVCRGGSHVEGFDSRNERKTICSN
jgi:hypothetical protein